MAQQQAHPRYNLSPGTLSGLYRQALESMGHGPVKGWHWPPAAYDAAVEMQDGARFYVGTDARSQVNIVPIED